MSSDFKYNFCFVVEEIFELGNATKYRMGKSLGSIRGRQATVDALTGNEHYPTIRRLRISNRLSVRKTEWFRTQSEHWTLQLLTHMIALWLQLPSSSSHKNETKSAKIMCQILQKALWSNDWEAITALNYPNISFGRGRPLKDLL